MNTTHVLALLAMLAGAARADVVLVDPGGGEGVALLQAEIAAAAPGDTLLLADGDYFGPAGTLYTLSKGLRLLPAPGAAQPALRQLLVTGLPAGEILVLRGLQIGGTSTTGPEASLRVVATAGAVWLEDCIVRGGDAEPDSDVNPDFGQAAASVGAGDVFFRNCHIQGGRGADAAGGPHVFSPAAPGARGLSVSTIASTVALHDCTILGGDGGDGSTGLAPSDGGTALDVSAADVSLSGCTLVGGAEGAGNDADPGTSGAALETLFASTAVRVVDSELQAGAVQGLGTVSPAVVDPPGKVAVLDEPARSLVLPDQLREGEAGVLTLDGEPGDTVLVFLAGGSSFTPLLGQEGTLVLDAGALVGPIALGVLSGPDGVVQQAFQMPHLPAALTAVTVFAQGVFVDGDGSSLGGASALTWIDSAF